MRFLNYLNSLLTGKADSGAAEPTATEQNQVTTVVHVGEDRSCFWAARDEESVRRIKAAAAVSPAVEIISEDDAQLVAAVPWAWVKIVIPSAGNAN